MTHHHIWKLSGKDGQAHAFATDGGYLESHDLISAVPIGDDTDPADEVFGPYQAFHTVCRQFVPVAMLLPLGGDTTCPTCMNRTGTIPRTGLGGTTPSPLRPLLAATSDPGL